MSLMQDITSGLIRYSIPAYRSSSFSLTITTSILGCLVSMKGWYETHGRTLAYWPNVLRVVTLRLLKPPPWGVVIGALRKTFSSNDRKRGWYEAHGRTFAYWPNVLRVVTLRLLKPPPWGVVIGALRKTLVRSSDSQELGSIPVLLPRR